jgi:thymidylate synthase
MSKIDKTYHQLLKTIMTDGYTYEDPNRKGVNRLEIPSYTFRHEFKDGFPAITTKKLNYKSVVTELIWFLRGDINIKYLVDNGCNIWNKDAYNYYLKFYTKGVEKPYTFNEFINTIKNYNLLNDHPLKEKSTGYLGPVYGKQWREIYDKNDDDISRYDQIKTLINTLKNSPLGTQHIVNAWNVLELDDMALQPCHYGFQVVVRPLSLLERTNLGKFKLGETITHDKCDLKYITKYGFELHWQQRSVDTFLGLPFNIASYATLALVLEKITGYKALAIQGDLKKVHLYDNSLDAVKEQLSRDVDKYDECELKMDTLTEVQLQKDINLINDIEPESFKLQNYESYPAINVKMLERDE